MNQTRKKIRNEKAIENPKPFTLEAELSVALEELAMYIIKEEEQITDITKILEKETGRADKEIRDVMGEVIRAKQWEVKLKSVQFDYCDSDNLTHGVAYFKVKLQGEKQVLERIAKDELFSEQDSPNIYQS